MSKRRWRDTDLRMKRAAELRNKGASLRQTAERLGVSYQTVARDLARWDAEQAKITHLPVTSGCHISAPDVTAGCDTETNIIPLRRSS